MLYCHQIKVMRCVRPCVCVCASVRVCKTGFEWVRAFRGRLFLSSEQWLYADLFSQWAMNQLYMTYYSKPRLLHIYFTLMTQSLIIVFSHASFSELFRLAVDCLRLILAWVGEIIHNIVFISHSDSFLKSALELGFKAVFRSGAWVYRVGGASCLRNLSIKLCIDYQYWF